MQDAALVAQLIEALGSRAVMTDPELLAPYCTDWKKTTSGPALCLVRPACVEDVALCVQLCAQAGVAIVPQGGNSGLAAGAVPAPRARTQVILTLERMNRIREIDPAGMTIAAEAGCVLKAAQDAAAAQGCLLPTSFAAEGTATIGGIVSTNAGGVNVLRYGMTRAQLLGLEVVLASGEVVSGMRHLRKDNAGYDWKQLFVGAEGTLGIVTAAVLRLVPRPAHKVTALLGVPDPERAVALLALAQREIGDQISAYELMSPMSVRLLGDQLGLTAPIDPGEGWLVLVEAASSLSGLHEAMETMLAAAFEQGLASDGVLAQSEAQAAGLWALRESVTEAEARSGRSAKHDVSVPVSAVPAFLRAADAALAAEPDPPRINAFGHLGDGNIHYNVLLGEGHDASRINRLVHDEVAALGGSISAEHGIGQYRVAELEHYAPPAEQALAALVKRALDPAGLFNPGKIFALRGRP